MDPREKREGFPPVTRTIDVIRHIAIIGKTRYFQLELNEIRGSNGKLMLDLRLFSIEGHIPRHGLNLRKSNAILLRDALIKYTNVEAASDQEADTEEEPKTEQE